MTMSRSLVALGERVGETEIHRVDPRMFVAKWNSGHVMMAGACGKRVHLMDVNPRLHVTLRNDQFCPKCFPDW